jgi:hypothetical protein
MYGLKEARVIAFNQLMEQLAAYGYEPMPFTPGLWRHQTKQIMFALCVNNFGVKYFSLLDPNHLINTIKATYDLTIDWTIDLYCGLSLNWHYNKGYINVSMPGYVDRALKTFEHPAPLDPQYAPHKGSSPPIDPMPYHCFQSPATRQGWHHPDPIHQWHLNVLRWTRLRPIHPPCTQQDLRQTGSTNHKNHQTDQFPMDYLLHTYPNGIIRYYVSNMVFKITSAAAYFVQPKAHSRAAAPFHLGWLQSTRNNGAVNILCKPIKNVVSSAVKAETGAIYMGGKHACPMRTALEELGKKTTGLRIPFQNRQQHGPRHPHIQDAPKTLHALRVDERPNQPRSI